ncbi:hypothetical protein WMY93_021970 [Mugilogobius chulae]|uniref:Uncharacterized protein n=1 Tax=Mugilogobius chulae TaxID=88201 RepID=A0AAW0NDD9_9GOBI
MCIRLTSLSGFDSSCYLHGIVLVVVRVIIKDSLQFPHPKSAGVLLDKSTTNIEPEMVSDKDEVAIQEVVQHQEEADVATIQESVMATKEQVTTKMDVDVKDVQEQASAKNQVVTPSNAVVAVPQNTGIISSVGNVEAPSSLSLEFKLNIQFGQSMAPTSVVTEQTISGPPQSPPASPPDRNETTKTREMSEIGVQAVEEEAKQENEPQKTLIVVAEAGVQATETTEQPTLMETLKDEDLINIGIHSAETEEPIKEILSTHLMDVSTQYAEISVQSEEFKSERIALANNQPVLINVGTQAEQPEEFNEEAKTTVEEISLIQVVETVQPKQELGVLLTELVVIQVSKDQTGDRKTEDDDENQDVWMDREEEIKEQEQNTMPLCEIEESFESEPDYFQETKSDFEESLESIKKITPKCEIDSEGEEFAAAIEDPQVATVIATIEWD